MHCSSAVKSILALLVFFFFYSADAQQKFTLSGYVKDSASGEDLIGAVLKIKDANTGTAANTYGFYTLTLPQGRYEVSVTSVGYEEQKISLFLNKNINRNFYMSIRVAQTKEVVISADNPRRQIRENQMGKVEIEMQKIKQLPVLFGEVDILKTLQLLPGVQSGSEGSTGFYVRGGSADQNLMVLDEAVVYNASHLFGFFSVFNSDAVKNVELYKGGYPASYGGRLSSVIDVKLKEGNKKKYITTGGIGLIASRLTFEGPLVKDKGSFIISGRRTYFDYFTKIYNESRSSDPKYNPIPDYYFYDLNAKLNYDLDSNNRLFLSGYFGRDVFNFKRGNFNFSFDWGNTTSTLRWNHIFSPKLFTNASATFTNYQYKIGSESDIFKFSLGSSIQDLSLKQDYTFSADVAHKLKFGWSYIYHTFNVGRVEFASTANNNSTFTNENILYGHEGALYVSDDWEATDKLALNLGLRLSGFNHKEQNYLIPEPRISTRYQINDGLSLKASYTHMAQYVNLVSSSGASLPTDVWYPTTQRVKPQKADQIAAGISTVLFDDQLLITNEVYYKKLTDIVDMKNGAQLFNNPKIENEFTFGTGEAYGNEIYIEKKQGKFTGWVGYTLAYCFVHFDSIPGVDFRPKYDTRHDLKVVGVYEITRDLTASATFVYNTGNLATIPLSFSFVQDIDNTNTKIVPIYKERNNFRMAPYHRLDLGLVWKLHPKWGSADVTFSVYNAYSRRNPYFYYYELNFPAGNTQLKLPESPAQAKLVSLFPVIPSVTFNFKF